MAAVFCGSRLGKDAAFADGAVALAAELVARNIGLVYGGGTIGLMGVVAHAVAEGPPHSRFTETSPS
jgi:cytokinin riboside 5'-monophosphate phosphoribohydrolase